MAVPGLSCGMWDLVPWPGIEPGPLHWVCGVLIIGPPDVIAVLQPLNLVWLSSTPWTAACQASPSITISLSFNISQIYVLLSQWCHPVISSSVVCFSSCPQFFPASGSFPMSQLFASGGQDIGASASAAVLPMSIQGWSPLRSTGLISLLSKGLSRVFSAPQFESVNSSALSLLYGSTLTSIHDYRKNHSIDYTDLCQQSDVCFLKHYLYLTYLFYQWASVF